MLVRLLEIQQIAHSISLTFVNGSNGLMSPQFSALPLIMTVKGFQAQIENFKSKIPAGYLVENGKSWLFSASLTQPSSTDGYSY